MKQNLILLLVLCVISAGCTTTHSNLNTTNASRSNVSPAVQNTSNASTQPTVPATELSNANKTNGSAIDTKDKTDKSDMKSSLVGKWKSDSSEGWEFKSNNKFERMSALGIPITGKYSADGENVILTFDPRDKTTKAPEPLSAKITISGNEMTLNDGQRVYTYKRE
jgi:hypothetical protein